MLPAPTPTPCVDNCSAGARRGTCARIPSRDQQHARGSRQVAQSCPSGHAVGGHPRWRNIRRAPTLLLEQLFSATLEDPMPAVTADTLTLPRVAEPDATVFRTRPVTSVT